MSEAPQRPGDIGSDATLDGSMLATAAPAATSVAGISAMAGTSGTSGTSGTRGASLLVQRELPAEFDRSDLSDRERELVVSRYRLLSRLGAGGMGLVYLAYDPSLDRKVAVKLLRPAGDGIEPAAEAHARLHREAQALAKLSHPNVVAVYDVGTYDASALYGTPRHDDAGQGVFLVMEYIKGVTLARWLEDRLRSWQEIVAVFLAAGRGLVAAHAVGVIHRDFKPSNVLVRSSGSVHVFDFGLARAAGGIEAPRSEAHTEASSQELWSATLSSPLTQFGAFVGTPAYMAPEQRGGEDVDERSDQFSFCVALYEGLYGNRPFSGGNVYALEMAKLSGQLDPPRRPRRLPKGLLRAVTRGLAPEPRERWPTLPALLAELDRLLRRRRGRIAAAALSVALLGAGAGAYAVAGGDVCTGAPEAFGELWGDASRAAITQAFTATGLSYAPDTAARVAERLDDYRARWLTVHTDACEAANVRRSQSHALMDRRMLCLHHRRDELAALLEVLAAADADVVQHAVPAVAGLPAVEQCADLVALGRADPLSADPNVALAIAEAERRLAVARAELAAGRYAATITLARASLAAAERLGERRLRAASELILGHAKLRLAEYGESESFLSAAYFDALAVGRDDTALASATLLATLIGDHLVRPSEGTVWARHIEALLERTGRPPGSIGGYQTVRAVIAMRTGDFRTAEVAYRAAIAAYELEYPRDELAIASVLGKLAAVISQLGKHAEALALLQRALAIHTDNLGPDHPDVAEALGTMGRIHALLGDDGAAEQFQRRALQIWRASLPPGHESLASPLSSLGDIAVGKARYDEARVYYDEARTIWRDHHAPDHPRVLGIQERLAGVLLMQGSLAPAHQIADDALHAWNGLKKPEPAGLTLILLIRAQIAIAEEDHTTARSLLTRAHNTASAAFGKDHLYAVSARMLLLGQRVEQGAHAEVLPDLIALVTGLEGQYGKDARWLVEPLLLLARARHGVGQYTQARGDLERGRKLAVDNNILALYGELDLAMARVLWDGGTDRPGARLLAQAAVEAARRSGMARSLIDAEKWLQEHPAP